MSEWVTDKPSSREATASKNIVCLSLQNFVMNQIAPTCLQMLQNIGCYIQNITLILLKSFHDNIQEQRT